MKAQPRIFTLEEANRILPELEAVLSQIYSQKLRHDCRHDAFFMEELVHLAEPKKELYDPGRKLEREAQELDQAFLELEKHINKVRELGCIIRSIGNGRIDFLGRLNGELVYFCWQLGEKSIQHYHPLRSPDSQRLLLSEGGKA